MTTVKRIVLTLSLMLLAACSVTERLAYDAGVVSTTLGLRADQDVVRTSSRVFPVDAGFYIASGESCLRAPASQECALAIMLGQQLSRRFPRVQFPEFTVSAEPVAVIPMEYTVESRVLSWHNRVDSLPELIHVLDSYPEPTGLEAPGPDRYEIQVVVSETATGRIVDIANVDTRGGLSNLVSGRPEKQVNALLARYVASLSAY